MRYDDAIPTLEQALLHRADVPMLRGLAALIPAKRPIPTRKAELAAVVRRFLEGDGLGDAWGGLDELQRAAVAEVVHGSTTRHCSERFAAKYGREPAWGDLERRSRPEPSALGLFFYQGVMPDDLKQRLRSLVPPPPAGAVPTTDAPPNLFALETRSWDPKLKRRHEIPVAVHQTEVRAARELNALLRLVDAGKVAVSEKTRRPSAAAIAEVTGILEGGDFYPATEERGRSRGEQAGPIRAFAWPMLLQAGGLAQPAGRKLRLTDAGRKAWGASPAQTIDRLWRGWTSTTMLDELSRIDCVKGLDGKGRRSLSSLSGRRDAIADGLAECPAGAWVAVDEFSRFLRAADTDFVVTRNAWNLYVGSPQYGALGYEGGAQVLRLRYLCCLLMEYAATLGLIDVAVIPPAGARGDYHALWGADDLAYFSRYDGLLWFRVNALGAFCLGIEGQYRATPAEAKSALRVLPNLEIVATGPGLDGADRLALDAYAVRVSDLVWRLDARKLLAAAEAGRPVAEAREYLQARGEGDLPDTVSRLLADTAARTTKVVDRGPARLVECEDAALAVLIASETRTRRHCLRAGDRHLVVPAASEAAFLRGLRHVGYVLARDAVRAAPVDSTMA